VSTHLSTDQPTEQSDDAVRRFLERRAGRADATYASIDRDDAAGSLRARDALERDVVMTHLGLDRRPTVLDVGCGTGRWGHHLAGRVRSYLGIDISRGSVALASPSLASIYPPGTAAVRTGEASQLLAGVHVDEAPFGLVIVGGVLAHLDDDQCRRCLEQIAMVAADDAVVYLREPVTDDLPADTGTDDGGGATTARPAAFYEELVRATLPGYALVLSRPLTRRVDDTHPTQHVLLVRGAG
jgi:SAM-dependent methyltransferase